jgi:hypothetical protein
VAWASARRGSKPTHVIFIMIQWSNICTRNMTEVDRERQIARLRNMRGEDRGI